MGCPVKINIGFVGIEKVFKIGHNNSLSNGELIGGHFTGSMVRHVLEAIAHHAGICLHVRVICGRDPHHIAEAEFKALARALRVAVEDDPRVETIPSTKGSL